MTPEELRALDAEVHTKVMGRACEFWRQEAGRPVALGPDWYDFGRDYPVTVPRYSTDIRAAWLVIEELLRRGWRYCVADGEERPHQCYFQRQSGGDVLEPEAEADTAPLAICRAALIASLSPAPAAPVPPPPPPSQSSTAPRE